MGLQPYGGDSFLRFQLRAKLRALQDDDRRILWEGIDSLNTIELRDACKIPCFLHAMHLMLLG
jgi:LETM1 and EF-hand domain-containing protein 1